ncbi:hypothetical protein SPUL_1207 [Salmonella enterica subsp. enterica serovar Gallinarum/Pullorum str. RKS5078]|nr:hypothetical protein SPUL_1207 [Salmonella enterica subsp. enterica serovar Gallinarum/Pullorum str. RKS5078]
MIPPLLKVRRLTPMAQNVISRLFKTYTTLFFCLSFRGDFFGVVKYQ